MAISGLAQKKFNPLPYYAKASCDIAGLFGHIPEAHGIHRSTELTPKPMAIHV